MPNDEPAGKPARVSLSERLNRFYATRGWLALLGTAASIIAVPLAFYLARPAAPRLMYRVSPSRSVVVAKARVGELRVLHRDREIEGDVTAVQFSVWNEGRGRARGTDVLSQLRIVTNPPTPILTASVQKRTRDVTEIGLDSADVWASGSIPVFFRIMEPGDGALIQLVYAGSPSVDISVVGVLEGQREIEAVGKPKPPSLGVKVGGVLLLVLIFVVAPITSIVEHYQKRTGPPAERLGKMLRDTLPFAAVLALLGGVLGLIALFARVFGAPPGPFPL